ncbi:sulfate reduction electron transfer complex DsrMKJOP subunit DsrM [Acetonema longum]|uniref:Nitrate reductase gamma subunit n=1 Tax=Acetonema longum DSM 6540 TaxID=1009370 RepID=F7NFF7_9FIRM|nr:sulfate reduction electron transfer complex DsrMKJOP subunit DsrM [Acetonema longum]EGO65212.1 nitrate reductase gamma subunit [Acetonema longum DSM 6540]
MGVTFSLIVIAALVCVVFFGVEYLGLTYLFGVIIPYAAITLFIGGFVYKVLDWAKAPVPFRIPTTCGQQKSLAWIQPASVDNPFNTAGVIARMALEILCFRSLLHNTRPSITTGGWLVYHWEKWLWLAALVFHWSLLIVVLRHLRFLMDPAPALVLSLQAMDGFFLMDLQAVYLTGIALLTAVTYLFLRRMAMAGVRYISLAADYLPLFLLMLIAASGLLMRYFINVDVTAVKSLMIGLMTFKPAVPGNIGILFYIHLFAVSLLIAYFPFSKLMHMGGVFMSPTRNMANNNRAVRHVNPWNYPVPVHTYQEYEDEFRDKMKSAGLPLEKE